MQRQQALLRLLPVYFRSTVCSITYCYSENSKQQLATTCSNHALAFIACAHLNAKRTLSTSIAAAIGQCFARLNPSHRVSDAYTSFKLMCPLSWQQIHQSNLNLSYIIQCHNNEACGSDSTNSLPIDQLKNHHQQVEAPT